MLTRSPLALLLALSLVLACVGKRGSGERPDASPQKAAKSRGAAASRHPVETDASSPKSAAAVPVVALDPSSVSPCERMCGRVGDCLISHEQSESAAASRIELACLDTCVNADPKQRASTDFQQCEGKDECGAVLGCARATWDAAAAARVADPISLEFAQSQNPCEIGCMAAMSCGLYYLMPSQSEHLQDAYFDQQVATCLGYCEQNEAWYSAFAECASSPDCDRAYSCTNSVIQARGVW